MARLPFIKFFPNDWLAEPTIRMCSVAARGLWMDMLSLMHLSPRRGYLLAASGSPLSPEQLARLTGCSADEATRLLAELKSSGVFSCTDDGTIFSRRMVRDEGKREKCAAAGRKGGLASATTRTLEGQVKGPGKGAGKGQPKLPEARGQITVPSEQSGPPGPASGGKAAGKAARPPNPNHRAAVQAFCDAWEARHGRKYPFAGGKDADAVSWLLAQVGNDMGAFTALVGRYLADGWKFAADSGHDLSTLRMKAARWLAPDGVRLHRPPPADAQRETLRQQVALGNITAAEAAELGGSDAA